MDVTIDVDVTQAMKKLQDVGVNVRQNIPRTMGYLGAKMERQAKENLLKVVKPKKVRTCTKQKSIGYMRTTGRRTVRTIRGGATSSGTSTVAYLRAGGAAEFLEFGTRPHPIRPVSREYLAFRGKDGKCVFLKMVKRHPGTKPKPFFFKAAEQVLDHNMGKIRDQIFHDLDRKWSH